jgi:predicted transposase
MMQTLKVKVETAPEQAKALLDTMHQFNAACNYVADVAFQMHTANKIKLQPIVYRDLREKFGISSQMAVSLSSLSLILTVQSSMTRESCLGKDLIESLC